MDTEPTDNLALPETPPEERPLADQDLVKPFTEHLEDLRYVLIKSLVAVAITCVVCLYFTDDIVHIYEWPLTSLAGSLPEAKDLSHSMLRSLHPADAFMMSIKVVVVTGLIFASPFIFYFIWGFIRPGLNPHEKRVAIPVFAGGILFFLLGVIFCYFVVLRICLRFFYTYTVKMNIQPDWSVDNYISFVAMLLLAFGLVFEMPVLAACLAKFKLITSRFLTAKRLHAYLVIAILSAILTPPDVFSQTLLIIPMIGLYEFSILVIKSIEKHTAR